MNSKRKFAIRVTTLDRLHSDEYTDITDLILCSGMITEYVDEFSFDIYHADYEVPSDRAISGMEAEISGDITVPTGILPNTNVARILIYCDSFDHMASVVKDLVFQLKDNHNFIYRFIIVSATIDTLGNPVVSIDFKSGCDVIPAIKLLRSNYNE